MGQHNAKELKGSKRDKNDSSVFSAGSNAVDGGTGFSKKVTGMRASAVRDNILQQRDQHRSAKLEGGTSLRKQEADGADGGESAVEKVPVVLRYAGRDVRSLLTMKEKVYVVVESLDWARLPMTASEDSFFTIVELPLGVQRFRFIVRGAETVDTTQPVETLPKRTPHLDMGGGSAPEKDTQVNIVCVNKALLVTKEDEEVPDDGSGWGQEETIHEEDRKHPPIMPVHLRYTPLNTPPTAARCARDGFMCAAEEDAVSPENLPIPLSVTVNHVYFQRREDHCVMGVTMRYCNKYTTTVYYSKVEPVAPL